MALTNERAEQIGKYLTEDTDRAKALLELSAEDAAKKLNAEGLDFTAEELAEFGQNLQAAAEASSDELSEEKLQDVSGGVLAAAAAGVYLTCITIGVTLGALGGSHKKW